MGLDIYMRHITGEFTREELDDAETAWNEVCDELYTEIPWSPTERNEENDKKRDLLAQMAFDNPDAPWAGKLESTGSRSWDYVRVGEEVVDLPSTLYPDALFRIGYFRSSYNGAGFNSVMRQYELPDLWDLIFGEEEDGADVYKYTPDWRAMHQRAVEALEQLTTTNTEFTVVPVRAHMLPQPNLPHSEALKIFMREKERFDQNPGPLGGSYSNAFGDFWLDKPLVVRGAAQSKSLFGGTDVLLIVDNPNGLHPSYREDLHIVVETCEYVIGQPDPENYYLVISG